MSDGRKKEEGKAPPAVPPVPGMAAGPQQVDPKEAASAYGKAAGSLKRELRPEEAADEAAQEPEPKEEQTGAPAGPPPAADATMLKEVDVLRRERDEYLDSVKRMKAEFDNYRRRSARDMVEISQRANEEMVFQLLPVVDNFERAIAYAVESGHSKDKVFAGYLQIYNQMMDLLQRSGLHEIEAEGLPFDPEVHEALITEESAMEPGTVIEVFDKGYALKGKVLRPAKVKVAR